MNQSLPICEIGSRRAHPAGGALPMTVGHTSSRPSRQRSAGREARVQTKSRPGKRFQHETTRNAFATGWRAAQREAQAEEAVLDRQAGRTGCAEEAPPHFLFLLLYDGNFGPSVVTVGARPWICAHFSGACRGLWGGTGSQAPFRPNPVFAFVVSEFQ